MPYGAVRTYPCRLTRTARDRVRGGFVGPGVRAIQGRARKNHAWLHWSDETYGTCRASWDLAPGLGPDGRGQQPGHPRERPAPGTPGADRRNLFRCGRNGCGVRRPSRTMREQPKSPAGQPNCSSTANGRHHVRAPSAPGRRPAAPKTSGAPPGAAPRHRRCPDVGADAERPRGSAPSSRIRPSGGSPPPRGLSHAHRTPCEPRGRPAPARMRPACVTRPSDPPM